MSSFTAVRPTTSVRAGQVISALVVVFLLFDAVIHVLRVDAVDQASRELGFPLQTMVFVGAVELVVVALYAVPRTSLLGAVLLTGYLGGAICTHVIAGSPLTTHVLFGVYVGVIAWAGLWLRDPALRALFPLKR